MTNISFKKTISNQFQPPWFDDECEKLLRDQEKLRAKTHSENGTEEDNEKFEEKI